MSLALLTAVDHRHEAHLVALLEGARDLSVVRRCADVPELLSVAAAGVADVAVVSATFRGVDRDALRTLAGHGVRVVGMCERGDEAGERALRQLGVHGVVHPDTEEDELFAALRAAGPSDGTAQGVAVPTGPGPRVPIEASLATLDPLPPAGPLGAGVDRPQPVPHAGHDPVPHAGHDTDDPSAGPGAHRGRLVAVWGPTGAPGRTSVAVTLAAVAATRGIPTLLVDADTWGASVGQSLGLLDEAPGLASAARLSEQGALDLASLSRVCPQVEPGLRVLTGIPRPDRWPEIRAAAMADILTTGRLLADLVVVDCGFCVEEDEELSYDTVAPRRNASTRTVLEEADAVVVVGAGDPIGLQRLVRAGQELPGLTSARTHVVVNKVRRASAGPDPQRAIGELLGRFSGLEDLTYLPWSPAELDKALWVGRSVHDVAPESPFVQALAGLAEQVLPQLTASIPATRAATRRSRRP